MARTQYTVTFPAAKAGDEVTWPNTVKVYPDSDGGRPLVNGYIEATGGSFTGWSDSASVTFTRRGKDGTTDPVTVTSGSPTGTGAAATTNAASPVNYCRLAVSISGALTVGNPGHLVTASELSIVSQHGTDFSIDEDAGGGGVVRSAAGGRFQACFYIGPGFSSSFDESSTATRYYWYGYTTGELDSAVNPLVGLGLDGFVPANVDLNFADTHASAPGDCPPGGIAFQNFGIFASGLTGTDSLSLDGVTLGAVWQIA